jgi:hypothetical protein
MNFDTLCNKLMVENTDSFNSMKEDDGKLRDLDYFRDPQKYENVQKELFKKYFDDIYSNKDWDRIKDVMKSAGVENLLYDVSQVWNRIYKKKIEELQKKLKEEEEKENGIYSSDLEYPIWQGYDNAGDTFKDEEHPDYYRLVYNSISQCDTFSGRPEPFSREKEIQDWYKANGYTW